MVHKHFCQQCNAMMAEEDFELCAQCRTREKAAVDWISAHTRDWH
jgi:RNA polymerase subunit RPABC4/transcription elongation factor Spt4